MFKGVIMIYLQYTISTTKETKQEPFIILYYKFLFVLDLTTEISHNIVLWKQKHELSKNAMNNIILFRTYGS